MLYDHPIVQIKGQKSKVKKIKGQKNQNVSNLPFILYVIQSYIFHKVNEKY